MKLIRDKYENIIKDKTILKADKNDLILKKHLLNEKLNEEIKELKDSDYKDPYEYADVLELLYSLMKFNNISMEEVLNCQIEKRDKFGSFDNFLILK